MRTSRRISRPFFFYLVCATPRSGSTLLCHALAATGVAGRPEEFFEARRRDAASRAAARVLRGRAVPRPRHVPDVDPPGAGLQRPARTCSDWQEHLRAALAHGTTPERRLRGEGDVEPPRRTSRPRAPLPELETVLARARGSSRPRVRVGAAPRPRAPGGLAVEGHADPGLARGRPTTPARPPRLRLRGARPPRAPLRARRRGWAAFSPSTASRRSS